MDRRKLEGLLRCRQAMLDMMRVDMPIAILSNYRITSDRTAMLIPVDLVNGFCKPGCGPLAPPDYDPTINYMIVQNILLIKDFIKAKQMVVFMRDCHQGEERPYPPHCQAGTFEAELVEPFNTMAANMQVIAKDCVNGWIGAEAGDESLTRENALKFLINKVKPEVIVVTGICTDICVKELVQSLLSARNRQLIPSVVDVVVDLAACATYDKPLEVCRDLGRPEIEAHPRWPFEYIGRLLMQHSGAILANNVDFD